MTAKSHVPVTLPPIWVHDDSLFWTIPAYLKAARQEVPGLSQEALAQEVMRRTPALAVDDDEKPITRETIANWETRRNLNKVETAVAVYSVLAWKGSPKAIRAMLGLLAFEQKRYERRILELDPERVRRERDDCRRVLKIMKADEKQFKAMLDEK